MNNHEPLDSKQDERGKKTTLDLTCTRYKMWTLYRRYGIASKQDVRARTGRTHRR